MTWELFCVMFDDNAIVLASLWSVNKNTGMDQLFEYKEHEQRVQTDEFLRTMQRLTSRRLTQTASASPTLHSSVLYGPPYDSIFQDRIESVPKDPDWLSRYLIYKVEHTNHYNGSFQVLVVALKIFDS